MHRNPFTNSHGRAPGVPFRAADRLRIANKIAAALGAFGLPSARCDASIDSRPAASLIDLSIVYLL
jgi:hypothetical protein